MAAEIGRVSESVQHMVLSGAKPLERYFQKEIERGIIDPLAPLAEIPVVDLRRLELQCNDEVQRFHSALTSWGCFQVKNHGMENSLLDNVRDVAEKFFALSLEEKQKYSREIGSIEGYGNDMVLSEDQVLDWTDRLYLTVSPNEKRMLRFWPKTPQNFRQTLSEYTLKLKEINKTILKAMAWSLNLNEACFLDKCGEDAMMSARFNFYPPCSIPHQILGLKPHADGSSITILLQDRRVGGLQVMKDDQWHNVPIVPDTLFINVGDQVEIMSNGAFKSPVHRVVTNRDSQRITLAVFFSPTPMVEIEPLPELLTETNPRLYTKVKNYIDIYFQYYQQGKRPIEAVKI